MPFVLVGWGAVVLALAGLGALGAHKLKSRAQRKSLLIVGPRQAGKTTVASILSNKNTTFEYKPTQHARSETINVAALNIRASTLEVTDTPGGEAAKIVIANGVATADLVCLVVSLDALEGNFADDNPLRLAKQIAHNAKNNTRTMLVLSHLDQSGLPSREQALVHERVQELKMAFGPKDVVAANLLDPGMQSEVAARIVAAF